MLNLIDSFSVDPLKIDPMVLSSPSLRIFLLASTEQSFTTKKMVFCWDFMSLLEALMMALRIWT